LTIHASLQTNLFEKAFRLVPIGYNLFLIILHWK